MFGPIDRVAARARIRELLREGGVAGYGGRRERDQRFAAQESANFHLRLERQNSFAERRAMRRGTLAEARIDRGKRGLFDARDIHHPVAIEDAEIGTLAGLLRERLKMGERCDPHPVAVEQARGERKNGKSHRQSSVGRILREISGGKKRLHKSISGRPRNTRIDRDIRHCQRVFRAGDDVENRKCLAQAFDG